MNNEELIGLVDNLKELNEVFEKMNKNFQESIFQNTSSSFDILTKSANNLTESFALVEKNSDFLEKRKTSLKSK